MDIMKFIKSPEKVHIVIGMTSYRHFMTGLTRKFPPSLYVLEMFHFFSVILRQIWQLIAGGWSCEGQDVFFDLLRLK